MQKVAFEPEYRESRRERLSISIPEEIHVIESMVVQKEALPTGMRLSF